MRRKIHFSELLIAICIFFLGYPVLVSLGLMGKTVEAVFGLAILSAGLRATPGPHKTPILIWILLPVLFAMWGAEMISVDDHFYATARKLILMIFFIRFIYRVGRDVFVTDKVDITDRLYGAICIYLLTAVSFADLYLIISDLIPDAFHCSTSICSDATGVFHEGTHIYFSLITLATVGYGDITPIQPLSGMVCAIEALIGQMYLGIVVARLVGLHLLESANEA